MDTLPPQSLPTTGRRGVVPIGSPRSRKLVDSAQTSCSSLSAPPIRKQVGFFSVKKFIYEGPSERSGSP